MNELLTEFEGKGEVNGIFFHQIIRSGKAYVYHRSDGYFEVFRRKVNIRFNCISYPSSKSFGIWAWCTKQKSKALAIFKNLNEDKSDESPKLTHHIGELDSLRA